MAQLKARKSADGSRRYTAVIRVHASKTLLHQESKTFTLRSTAEKWARHREVTLDNPGALALERAESRKTLAQLIRWYIEAFQKVSRWQRTKQSHLEFLERDGLGKANALALTSALLVDHIRSRRADGAGPATVANDLIWIGVGAQDRAGEPARAQFVRRASSWCG